MSNKGLEQAYIEIFPTERFYNNFRLYQPDRKCKECGQTVKCKRPETRFFFDGKVQGSDSMIRVWIEGRKNVWRLHKDYFYFTSKHALWTPSEAVKTEVGR